MWHSRPRLWGGYSFSAFASSTAIRKRRRREIIGPSAPAEGKFESSNHAKILIRRAPRGEPVEERPFRAA